MFAIVAAVVIIIAAVSGCGVVTVRRNQRNRAVLEARLRACCAR